MKTFQVSAVVLATAVAFSATALLPVDASAAPRTAYAAKKAQCKQRAALMNFGMHVIKKNRWVKDCIASAR